MSLLARIQARACAFVYVHPDGSVTACEEPRGADAEVCSRHLNELWLHRLERRPDGSYVARRAFAARDLTGSIRSAA